MLKNKKEKKKKKKKKSELDDKLPRRERREGGKCRKKTHAPPMCEDADRVPTQRRAKSKQE